MTARCFLARLDIGRDDPAGHRAFCQSLSRDYALPCDCCDQEGELAGPPQVRTSPPSGRSRSSFRQYARVASFGQPARSDSEGGTK